MSFVFVLKCFTAKYRDPAPDVISHDVIEERQLLPHIEHGKRQLVKIVIAEANTDGVFGVEMSQYTVLCMQVGEPQDHSRRRDENSAHVDRPRD